MGFFDNNKLAGNIARIQEMKQGKAGNKKISDTFKKEGMDLEPHHIKAIYEAVPQLKKKVLKKKIAQAVISECAASGPNQISGGDIVPDGT